MGEMKGRAKDRRFRHLFQLSILLFLFSIFFAPRSFAEGISFTLNTGVSGQQVYLTSEIWKWDPHAVRMPEVSPGKYSVSFPTPWIGKIHYKYLVNGEWTADPENPMQDADAGVCNSLLTVRAKSADEALSSTGNTPAWNETEVSVSEAGEGPGGITRPVTIVHPPVLDPNRKVAVVYLQDGTEYREHGQIKTLLANLSLDQSLPIIIGVLIPHRNRIAEYGLARAYSDFVAKNVVSSVEARLGLKITKNDRLIMGPSMGGLASLFIALEHPEVFGNVASQSGSVWYPDKLAHIWPRFERFALDHPGAKDLRIYLDVGAFETQTMKDFNADTFALAQRLGFEVDFHITPAHHSWHAWRNGTSAILRSFFGERR